MSEEPPSTRPTRPDCPGCGAPDLAGDDFCHDCGHSFEHFGASATIDDAEGPGHPCPICATGLVVSLEYGRDQCEACGYTARDEG